MISLAIGIGLGSITHAGFGNGSSAYVYSTVAHFGTPRCAVKPFGLAVTTLGQVKRTVLLQNFPNPFNPVTWLPYRLTADDFK